MSGHTIAIIGGGIAGITAALELSQHDVDIHLIEKSPFLGGHAIHYSCKANGTCLRCNACLVEEQLKRLNEAENVHIHLASRIQDVEKSGGSYRLQTTQSPLFESDEEQRILKSLANTEKWKHIVLRGPSKNNRPLYALDWSQMEGATQQTLTDPEITDQLDLNKAERSELIQADAIVLASGFQPFDPYRIGTYNCSSLKNVVSALELEKIRRSSGYHLRPSDGEKPQKVAFIQCVGSRNEAYGNLWCSRVCCPYALRMAREMQSEQPETAITFFYMDIQNCDRDPNKTLSTCRSNFRFIRMMPVDILPGEHDSVRIRYMSEQEAIEQEPFDMVVLSVGMEPGPESEALAGMLGIELNRYGFFRTASGGAQDLEKSGVFPAGAATGPKDIAESMEQAKEAAKDLLTYLSLQEKKDNGYERNLDSHTGADYRNGVDRSHGSP